MKNIFSHAINVVRSSIREGGKRSNRSSKWPKVEREKLAAQPFCEACGQKVRLQVHHEKPFHLYPDLELVLSNLIVLCMGRNECHLVIGHGDHFAAYNPNVRADVLQYRGIPPGNSAMKRAVELRARIARLYDRQSAKLKETR